MGVVAPLSNIPLQPVAERYKMVDRKLTELGGTRRFYDPFGHPELLFAFERVRTGEELLEFAQEWGVPGHFGGWSSGLVYERHFDPDEYDSSDEGSGKTLVTHHELQDALPHSVEAEVFLGHATTIRMLLSLVRAMSDGRELDLLMKSWNPHERPEGWTTYSPRAARKAGWFAEFGVRRGVSLRDAARSIVAEVANANLEAAPLRLWWNGSEALWEFAPSGDLLTAIYWHFCNWLRDEKPIHRCEECGTLFEPARKGQRYCPALPGKSESKCALRARQRTFAANRRTATRREN